MWLLGHTWEPYTKSKVNKWRIQFLLNNFFLVHINAKWIKTTVENVTVCPFSHLQFQSRQKKYKFGSKYWPDSSLLFVCKYSSPLSAITIASPRLVHNKVYQSRNMPLTMITIAVVFSITIPFDSECRNTSRQHQAWRGTGCLLCTFVSWLFDIHSDLFVFLILLFGWYGFVWWSVFQLVKEEFGVHNKCGDRCANNFNHW